MIKEKASLKKMSLFYKVEKLKTYEKGKWKGKRKIGLFTVILK